MANDQRLSNVRVQSYSRLDTGGVQLLAVIEDNNVVNATVRSPVVRKCRVSFKQVTRLVVGLIWEGVKYWLARLMANNCLLENVVTNVLIFATKLVIVKNEKVPVLVVGLPVYRVDAVSNNLY